MTINPIPDYSPIQHPQRMTVSNTTTLVTDRGANPNGFTSPFRCGFQIRVPSAWDVTTPTFPTRDLVVTEVPLGMHHLGITMTINPITDYNPIKHPCGMTVSNTMTLVTDRSTKGIFFRTLLFSYTCPIDVDCHKPDISNRRSFRDGGTTRYASPRDG